MAFRMLSTHHPCNNVSTTMLHCDDERKFIIWPSVHPRKKIIALHGLTTMPVMTTM